MAIGSFNDIDVQPPSIHLTPYIGCSDPMGGGLAGRNALTVLRNANTGIGTATNCVYMFADSNVVFTEVVGFAKSSRIHQYKDQACACFGIQEKRLSRTGATSRTTGTKDSIRYSICCRFGYKSKRWYSTALGVNNGIIPQEISVTVGTDNNAGGTSAIAIGNFVRSRNLSELAMRNDLIAKSVSE
jgi:hypothetical protein